MCIRIIGCGNILRQDDGIGVYVIEELKKSTLPKDIELIDAGTRGVDIPSFLEGAKKVIIVDGVKGNGRAGEIYRIDLDEEMIEPGQLGHLSTHDLGWEDALVIAKEILGDRFPKKVTFWGIEIEDSEPSLGLRPILKGSLYKVVELIQKELIGEGRELKQ